MLLAPSVAPLSFVKGLLVARAADTGAAARVAAEEQEGVVKTVRARAAERGGDKLGDAELGGAELVDPEPGDADRGGVGSLFYGPMSFDAAAGQALNTKATVGAHVAPAKVLIRKEVDGARARFGSVQFSNASHWNGGNAKLTLAFVLGDTTGVQRDLHWHTEGDEWAYVIKGQWRLTMAAPSAFSPRRKQVPWKAAYGTAGPDSVWYFPAGWWHNVVCETPSGCAAVLFFNSPPSHRAEPNSPQLAQAVHGDGPEGSRSFGPRGMPDYIAAHVLGTSVSEAQAVQARLAGASASNEDEEYLLSSIFDLTNACHKASASCPRLVADTSDDNFPAVVPMKSGKGVNTRTLPFLQGGAWTACEAVGLTVESASGTDAAPDSGGTGDAAAAAAGGSSNGDAAVAKASETVPKFVSPSTGAATGGTRTGNAAAAAVSEQVPEFASSRADAATGGSATAGTGAGNAPVIAGGAATESAANGHVAMAAAEGAATGDAAIATASEKVPRFATSGASGFGDVAMAAAGGGATSDAAMATAGENLPEFASSGAGAALGGAGSGDAATAAASANVPEFAGATMWDVTAANGFELLQLSALAGGGGSAGRGLSGQLVELRPGATRPPVWILNSDAALFVVYGTVTLWMYVGDEFAGFTPRQSMAITPSAQTQTMKLSSNQAAYIPTNSLYYFTAGCDDGGAKVTLAFNHPEWEEIDMRESLALFPKYQVEGSLNEPGPVESTSTPTQPHAHAHVHAHAHAHGREGTG